MNDSDSVIHRVKRRNDRPYCVPLLLVFMAVVATIGSNFRAVVLNPNNEPGTAATVKHAATNRTKTNVIELKLSTNQAAPSLEHSQSNIGSFFDCNRPESKCHYFYPGEFVRYYRNTYVKNADDGSNDHTKNVTSDHEKYLQWRRRIGLENANLPALDSLSWWAVETNDGSPTAEPLLSTIQNHINLPQNITYIHVHKCGGTSIQGAMYRKARQIRKTSFHIQNDTLNEQPDIQLGADMHTYKHSFGGGSREKKEKWDGERLGHINSLGSTRQKALSYPSLNQLHPIFTVVRDPISRFLSAVQQVMHYNTEFREKCLYEEPPQSSSSFSHLLSKKHNDKEEREAQLRQRTIQCAIQDMKETNYRRDVHLVPIISHFRLLDDINPMKLGNAGHSDIAVSVFPMENIQDLLQYIGNSEGQRATNNSKELTIIHARDRSDVEYATSSILAGLSSSDCNEEMIRQICTLYHVDVELMKWLGFGGEAVERCGVNTTKKKHPPLSLNITKNGVSQDDIISQLFPFIGHNRHLSVTSHDVEIGHRWKTYLFPLEKKWNEDAVLAYINSHGGEKIGNCFTKSCEPSVIEKQGGQFTDYLAEIIILRKLLASLDFVDDPKEADLVLVPALGVSNTIRRCRLHGLCKDGMFTELRDQLDQYSEYTKKHLFLSTQDFSQNHPFFEQQHLRKHGIVVSLGPQGLVVPSLNSESSLQPAKFEGCKPLDKRKNFLLANFGTREWLKDRQLINRELDGYNGTQYIARSSPDGIQDQLIDSIMVICPPGDLPFAKRFYDAILSCSIPVVVKRDIRGTNGTYWSNVEWIINGNQHFMFSVAESYPTMEIPYSDLVVEVDGHIIETQQLMDYLEKIPMSVLESKIQKINAVRKRFVFDFDGTAPDAFTTMIETLETHINRS